MRRSIQTATLEHIYNEHVRNRIGNIALEGTFEAAEINATLARLKRAARILRLTSAVSTDDDDMYRTFTTSRLQELTADIANGLNLARRLAEASGFLDALDEYFDVMVQCLSAQALPAAEAELLSELGSPDSERELTAIVTILQTRMSSQYGNHYLHGRPGQGLRQTEEQLQKVGPKPEGAGISPRRWFKSLGQIGTGAATTIIDIAAGCGMFGMKTDPVTCVTSVTTGVGMILVGFGEWRRE